MHTGPQAGVEQALDDMKIELMQLNLYLRDLIGLGQRELPAPMVTVTPTPVVFTPQEIVPAAPTDLSPLLLELQRLQRQSTDPVVQTELELLRKEFKDLALVLRAIGGSGHVGGAASVVTVNQPAAPWLSRDFFPTGEVLPDQTAVGAALTFTFSAPVQLMWVMTTGVEGRADPFGGTPTATTGIRLPADTPIPIAVQTSSIKVLAASGGVSVYGCRY